MSDRFFREPAREEGHVYRVAVLPPQEIRAVGGLPFVGDVIPVVGFIFDHSDESLHSLGEICQEPFSLSEALRTPYRK